MTNLHKYEAANDRISDAIIAFRDHPNASLPNFSAEDIVDVAKFQAWDWFNEYRREFGRKRAVEILTLLARVYAAFSVELNDLLRQE